MFMFMLFTRVREEEEEKKTHRYCSEYRRRDYTLNVKHKAQQQPFVHEY